jgi:hypothetical protein
MPLLPLKIPPGVYSNGTDYEASGRWREASLVRWQNESLRPVGGWRDRVNTAFASAPRSLITWEDNSSDRWVAAGAFDSLYTVSASNTVRDITPATLTSGLLNAEVRTGYGNGFYGSSFYGTSRPDTGNYSEATTWSLDNWGEYLVGCSVSDGTLWEWDLDTAVGAETVTNGEFAADSDWTKGTGWTIAAGVASFSGSAVADLSQVLTVVSGETYEVTFTLVDASADEARVVVTTSGGNVLNATFESGTHTVRFLSDDTSATLKFQPAEAVASAFDVDDVSVKKVPAAKAIANAPADNLGLMVTEERFLFALGAGGVPRKVQWSDREDNTTWTPLATNEAGDIELQTSGQIMAGIRSRGQSLILTDVDAHSVSYIGPPFVYGFERVGTACGLIARNAVATTDNGVFWMGSNGFFLYNGTNVQEIPCEVHDYVFGDINPAQVSKAWAMTLGQQGEVWWFYASSASVEIDRYVALDFKEGHWMTGELSRTCGADRGVFKYPFMADANGSLIEHEVGLNYGGAAIYAETGPISLGAGDQVMNVRHLIPDEKTQGDVSATFKTRFYPNDTERSYGPYSMANPTSVRFTGRQVRMRVEGNTLSDWRVGTMRIDVATRGNR